MKRVPHTHNSRCVKIVTTSKYIGSGVSSKTYSGRGVRPNGVGGGKGQG